MNTAEYVDELVKKLKADGVPLSDAAWQTARACVEWAYVFGARGQYCTPANRRAREREDHPTIKSKCQVLNGSKSACSGCKWYPQEKKTRFFDCRGFTYWVLKQVFNGWELMGAGATSQWNTESNWKAKGEVSDGIPDNVIVCLFYYKKDKNGKRTKTLEHTGLYYNGETCECSSGVQYSKTLNKKWEVWGVPACVEGDIPTPDPDKKPTLRNGSSGEYVTLLQTELLKRGYDLGKWGADGKFGAATEKAVKAFQKDVGLESTGVVNADTWEALEAPMTRYKVTIPDLSKGKAEELVKQYPGAVMKEQG